MNHRFSWRLGLAVILLLIALFAVFYPNLIRKQNVPVRQTTEIRTDDNSDDATARQAIQRDNTN